MNERTIMDRAGDLWTVEDPRPGVTGGTVRIRCRHELGFELTLTLAEEVGTEDRAIVDALERARRSLPRAELVEAA